MVRSVFVRRGQPVRHARPERRHRTALPQHGRLGRPDRQGRDARAPAVPDGRLRSLQSSQLRSAGERRRQRDLREDHADAVSDRRGRILSSDSARAQGHVLMMWWRIAAGVLAAVAMPHPSAAASPREPDPPTVVTVYWSSEDFTGTQEVDAAIQASLRSGLQRVDYFSEYLESDRFPE